MPAFLALSLSVLSTLASTNVAAAVPGPDGDVAVDATLQAPGAPSAEPPKLLKRPRSRWRTGGKSLSVVAAEDVVTSLQQAGWIAPDGLAFVETRGAYELLTFGVARDGCEGSFEVLRPARALESQFEPPKRRGARLDATRSAHTYDAVGDTFVGVEMTRGTSAGAAKVRDELIGLASDVLFGQVRPTSRDFAPNLQGNYPGSTQRFPASAFSLQGLSAVLREAGWRVAAAPLPVVQVGAYEMVRFSTGSGVGKIVFTIVRPASSFHLRTPFTPPSQRHRELHPSSSAFVHDDVGDTFAAVRLSAGGTSDDANALLQRLLTQAGATNLPPDLAPAEGRRRR